MAGWFARPVYFLLRRTTISACVSLRRPFILVVFILVLYACSNLYYENCTQNICFLCYLRTLHYLHVCCEGTLFTIPTGAECRRIRPPKRPIGIYIVPGPRNIHLRSTTLTGAERVGSLFLNGNSKKVIHNTDAISLV